ncbi:MAG: winged helix-turn-helix transcriptional regulator [Clostridia bacterium]|nr:winged helix-turn-helix transcriptional regulator [Clostridia bacterium]
MERNFTEEIDALQQQLAGLQEGMQQLMKTIAPHLPSCAMGGPNPTIGHVEVMENMHPNPHLAAVMNDLQSSCGENGSTGRITYLGVFASGGRQSNWIRHDLNTDTLLPLIENRTAEKVLACVGSNDRLNMLLAILRKPRTVAELVSDCGYSSTGQVYHHLKPLIAADLVAEDEHRRGSYVIRPHRVQGVIMLLAGIADLVDGTFTQGAVD